jgi:hypothetical protein
LEYLPLRFLLAWLSLISLPGLLSAQAPLLPPEDLYLPGWPEFADTASIRKLLGPPKAVSSYTGSGDPIPQPIWVYPSLEVYFSEPGEALAVTLTAPGPKTSRGIQVGDTVAALEAAYGLPHSTYNEWRYWESESSYMLIVKVVDGRVREIHLGSTLTGE